MSWRSYQCSAHLGRRKRGYDERKDYSFHIHAPASARKLFRHDRAHLLSARRGRFRPPPRHHHLAQSDPRLRNLLPQALRTGHLPKSRPQTGPDGGGDSKAESETVPVSDEIITLTYVGEPNAGKEKWAFAFSAKEKWLAKARSDVDGIAKTERGYKRIIFVTSRYAKAKARAALEDELTKEHGIEVTIHDRSWILQQVIEFDRKDLAYNYLHVGQEVVDASSLGPADYSRTRQLEAIEKSLFNPDSFSGMERQGVTEALLAAKLSRSLERPRPETEGRFRRAIRLGDAHGTYRQKLEARYEALWTVCLVVR